MDNLCKECGAEIMRPKKNGPKPKYCSARCREILNYKKQRGKLIYSSRTTRKRATGGEHEPPASICP